MKTLLVIMSLWTAALGAVHWHRPDLDGDGDVDGMDYTAFVDCFNGSNNRPACEATATRMIVETSQPFVRVVVSFKIDGRAVVASCVTDGDGHGELYEAIP